VNLSNHLKVIDFIKSTANWREILSAAPYNLLINDDGDFTILKYSQIDSDLTNAIVRECRGLIIDREYNAVCVPFFKFFNYGEPCADEIDWATALVEEKIDGSLIKVWNYKGKWIISTNGTIFAEKTGVTALHGGKTKEGFGSFAGLFTAAASSAGLCMENLNPQYTYMFELCSPYNRVVVPHNEIKIYHIGTRDCATLRELDIDIGVVKPKTYRCDSIDGLVEMASKLKYCEEGYVVRDSAYRRVKIKSPSYVAFHHLVSNLSDRRLLDLLRKNEVGELLAYFPEYQGFVDNLTGKISAIEKDISNIQKERFDSVHFETKKDYAAVALQTKYSAFFFNYYNKKVSTPGEWIWGLANNKILELLERVE
jgi:hypothetical protein